MISTYDILVLATLLAMILLVAACMYAQLIFITNQNKAIMAKQERMDAAVDTLLAAFVEIADDLNALIEAEKDNISEESLAKLEGTAAKAKELGDIYEKPTEPEEQA